MTGDELRNSNHTMATLRKYYKKETMKKPSMLFVNLKWSNYHGCYKGKKTWEDFFLSLISLKNQQNSFPISVLASKNKSHKLKYFTMLNCP